MDIEMQSVGSGASADASGITKQPEPISKGPQHENGDRITRRKQFVLLVAAGLSNLLCWPIGIIALWKIVQIRNVERGGDKARTKVALRDATMLLYHALGWGLLLYLVLAIVTIVQYSADE